MIAFEIFWRPIYRYGLFYLITFVSGYAFLARLPRHSMFAWGDVSKNTFPQLYSLLQHNVDDLFLICMLGVIVWGRLWHVLFYDLAYYSTHLLEIVQINKWWMSFVWGIIWVVLWLIYITRKHALSWREFRLLGDMVLCIVPIWSALGRIWNMLNQELIGRKMSDIAASSSEYMVYIWELIQTNWLTKIYDRRDTIERVNVNLIQSMGEWVLLFLIVWWLFLTIYRKSDRREKRSQIYPGLIAWVYMIGYAVVRFWVEYLKELPDVEMYGMFSVSQWLMCVLFLLWLSVLWISLSDDSE